MPTLDFKTQFLTLLDHLMANLISLFYFYEWDLNCHMLSPHSKPTTACPMKWSLNTFFSSPFHDVSSLSLSLCLPDLFSPYLFYFNIYIVEDDLRFTQWGLAHFQDTLLEYPCYAILQDAEEDQDVVNFHGYIRGDVLEEEKEDDSKKEKELVKKVNMLMEKITSRPDKPKPANLHGLASILQT